MVAPSKPLTTPIDVSRVKNERGVKDLIKRLLNQYGWFTWMPGANGYGAQGVPDHLAIKDGVFLAVEAKFGTNKPSAMQKSFAAQLMANEGFCFCVSERNIDHLAWWLESFAISQELTRLAMAEGRDPEQAVPQEHGARMLNAISALTDAYAGA